LRQFSESGHSFAKRSHTVWFDPWKNKTRDLFFGDRAQGEEL
jgi:hypothetical protein